MGYAIKVINNEHQKTSKWSGGTTTELCIYPENSDYKTRDFLWRISSAVVELEESTFTHLPDVQRIIMVLDGKMKLEHEEYYTIELNPFEQDSFSGDWTTRSFGKVRDFNLMMREGCKGKLEVLDVKNRFNIEIKNQKKCNFMLTEAFYSLNNNVEITINDTEIVHLHNGDLMLIYIDRQYTKVNLSILNKDIENKKLIRASIEHR